MARIPNPPLCVLRRNRAIELPSPESVPPGHSIAAAAGTTDLPTTNLNIALVEATHHTHAAYITDISTRPDLVLSALTARLHWRAHSLLQRVIVFHWTALTHLARAKKRDGSTLVDGARRFVEERENGTDADGVPVVLGPGAQLLALKRVVNALTARRVLDTLAWIENQEVAARAVRLDARSLGAAQRWCTGCIRAFYAVSTHECGNEVAMTQDPMGVKRCGHVLCRECMEDWLYDHSSRVKEGTQPCCSQKLERNTGAVRKLREGIPG